MNPVVRTKLSIMMFLQYFVWGLWFVTLGTFLFEGLKFEGPQIGNTYSAMWIAAMVSPLFVGMVADRFFSTERILALLHLVGAGVLYWVSQQQSFNAMFFGVLVYGLCYMPTLALTNSISFHQMTDPEKQFPAIRVLGTIGWIAAGFFVGKARLQGEGLSSLSFLGAGASIEPTSYPLLLAAYSSVVLAVFCLFLPHTPPNPQKEASVSDILGLDAISLMKDRSFAVFVIGSFLICIPLQFYYAFTNQFLNAIGVEDAAFKQTYGQMSEIFFMLLMPLFFVRLGVKWMLLVGIMAWVARYLLFSTQVEGLIIIGLILHGVCYDFFFVTGQIYVDKVAPHTIRGKAQGFLALVTLGAGQFVGAQLGGRVLGFYTDPVEGTIDWQHFWMAPAIGAAVIMVIFGLLFKDRQVWTRSDMDPALEIAEGPEPQVG